MEKIIALKDIKRVKKWIMNEIDIMFDSWTYPKIKNYDFDKAIDNVDHASQRRDMKEAKIIYNLIKDW